MIDFKTLKFNELRVMEKDPNWLRAFADYNEAHPEARLSVVCRPCYIKVHMWLKEISK